jgi:hypothetical protein
MGAPTDWQGSSAPLCSPCPALLPRWPADVRAALLMPLRTP